MSKRGLGKGLDALLGGAAPAAAGAAPAAGEKIAIDRLVPGKYQPRRRFAAPELNALADSIRQHGVIQPIVVRPQKGGKYEIIAGERRWRAAKLAGLPAVPAVIRDLRDDEAQIFALVENLQRADLNPIEQAQGLERLIKETGVTHAKAAEIVGLSRPAVSNLLRLLDLSAAVQKHLTAGHLEMGHARALLALPKNRQEAAAAAVIARSLTTRRTEQLVKDLLAERSGGGGAGRAAAGRAKNADTARLEKELSDKLAMRVQIAHSKAGSGKVTLHYGSLDTLDALLVKLRK